MFLYFCVLWGLSSRPCRRDVSLQQPLYVHDLVGHRMRIRVMHGYLRYGSIESPDVVGIAVAHGIWNYVNYVAPVLAWVDVHRWGGGAAAGQESA